MTGRHLFASGRITPSRMLTRPLARYCAWHGDWMSDADEKRHNEGAATTHGMCDDCAREQHANLDTFPKDAA